MKKNSILVALLAVVSFLFVSCDNAVKKQYAVIPDDSPMLAKVNLGNLINESEILEVSMVRTALDFMVNTMPRDLRRTFSEISVDPSKSGINVNEPLVLSISVEPVEMVVAMAVSDKERLVEVFEALADGSGAELVEDNGLTKVDLSVLSRRNEFDVVFNSDVIVLAFSEKGNADAEYYMNLDSDEQAVNNKRYADFFAVNSDASFFMDTTPIFASLTRELYMSEDDKALIEMYTQAEIAVLANLNFEKGYAQIDSKVYATEEYLGMLNDAWLDVNKKFLEYIPESAVAVFSAAMNWEKVLDMNPQFEELVTMIEELGFNKDMLKDISGDVVLALLPAENICGQMLPQALFAIECKSREVVDVLLENFPEDMLTEVETDVYALGLNKLADEADGYDYYLMYKADAIWFLPENIYSQIVKDDKLKALKRNIADNPMFSVLDDACIVADADAIIELCGNVLGHISPSAKSIMDFCTIFENMEVVMEEPTESLYRINMKYKNANVLKQLVDEAFALASSAVFQDF